MEARDISELFLTGFMHAIASVARKAPEDPIEIMQQQNMLEKKYGRRSIEMLPEFLKPMQTISAKRQVLEIGGFRPQITEQITQPMRFVQSRPFQQQYVPQNRQEYLLKDINQQSTADKLNFLIKDPAVTEIECTGSDQPLLVKKGGSIQRTRVKLSVEEIYQLISEFSQKTKIPVIEGTFKAALSNVILTAVLSEILGPRFILQKKNPFQQLVQ